METVAELISPQGEKIDLSGLPDYQRITADMVDTAPEFVPIYLQAVNFTMTSAQNMFALYSAVKYIAETGIAGDIVECGVWRGGSCMVAALALQSVPKDAPRRIWLYDTFSGMPEPTDVDQPIGVGRSAIRQDPRKIWRKERVSDERSNWCYASLDDVKQNLRGTGYPAERIEFVAGKVEETIPARMPSAIACLRLDTDWYESTYHELTHLYPLLAPGGVLLLDDYGFWEGQKKAVDRYFEEQGIKLFLQRVDANARLAIKTR